MFFFVTRLLYIIIGKCFIHNFIEDCVWGPWGNFTECTETCGGGFKTRSRVVATPPLYGGAACEGDAFESIICNPDPCPGK